MAPDLGFLRFIDSFRYALSGEFAMKSQLARVNRLPSDWGLEVGTLAEVYRNCAVSRVCQVDLADNYEHKHQELSQGDPSQGLRRMTVDIAKTLFRTLASEGVVFTSDHFRNLQVRYVRMAEDTINRYYADAMINGLTFDRHAEEMTVNAFTESLRDAAASFLENPLSQPQIPNWNRVLAAAPDFFGRLLAVVRDTDPLAAVPPPATPDRLVGADHSGDHHVIRRRRSKIVPRANEGAVMQRAYDRPDTTVRPRFQSPREPAGIAAFQPSRPGASPTGSRAAAPRAAVRRLHDDGHVAHASISRSLGPSPSAIVRISSQPAAVGVGGRAGRGCLVVPAEEVAEATAPREPQAFELDRRLEPRHRRLVAGDDDERLVVLPPASRAARDRAADPLRSATSSSVIAWNPRTSTPASRAACSSARTMVPYGIPHSTT